MSKLFSLGGSTTDSVPAGRSGEAGGALSSIAAERMVGSGRDQAHSMRQCTGTTMACVTWRYVPRGTCHVPPREPLRKQALGQNFRRGGRRDPKLAGYMRPGMAHVRVTTQNIARRGQFRFLACVVPTRLDLGRKFGTNEASKGYPPLWGPKIRGSVILNFRKKFILIISEYHPCISFRISKISAPKKFWTPFFCILSKLVQKSKIQNFDTLIFGPP